MIRQDEVQREQSGIGPVAYSGSWMPEASEVLGCPQIKIFFVI